MPARLARGQATAEAEARVRQCGQSARKKCLALEQQRAGIKLFRCSERRMLGDVHAAIRSKAWSGGAARARDVIMASLLWLGERSGPVSQLNLWPAACGQH